MLPWKVFIRTVGVATLLTTAGFAAGQDVLPFSHVSRSVSPDVVVDETAPDADETPAVDDAVLPGEDSTTTTTAPDSDAPDADTDDPAPTTPPVVEVPEAPETPTTTAPPAAAPDDDDATPIATTDVDVVRPDRDHEKKAKGDHNCDGHLDNGWHKTDGAHPATGEKCTPGDADEAKPEKGDRPETAPGQVKKAERSR